MKKFHLIAVRFVDSRVNPEQVQNFISHCRDFSRWWNNIPLVWIVETEKNSDEVANIIAPTIGEAHFFVTEISPYTSQGLLPKYAWDWFYEAAPQGALAGLRAAPRLPPRR